MPYASVEATQKIEVTGEVPWWEQTFFNIPVWGWILGGAAALIVTAGAAVAYQEEERRRMMMMLMAR